MADKSGVESPRPRNLRREEIKQVILAFAEIIRNIKINEKPFALNVTSKMIAMNPNITMDELQKTLSIKEKNKLDFIRQLYIRSGNNTLKKLFPDDNILNLPVISFSLNGESISLNY